jgi:hypothetical protein
MADNESLYIALGLKPDADFESAVITASEKSEALGKLLTITKAASFAEALGIVQANALSAERYSAAEAKLAKIEKEAAEKDFDAAAKAGDLAGKFTPAMAKSDWAKELRAKGASGVQELKSFLQHAPVLVSRKPIVEDDGELENVELSAQEIEVARKMEADPKSLKTRLDALRAQKLEDLKMKKAASR